MLSVVRELAEEAESRAGDAAAPLGELLVDLVRRGEEAVARTPEQLDVLRESGVVDAGGQGLFRLLEGAALARGPHAHAADAEPAPEITPAAPIQLVPGAALGGEGVVGASGGEHFGYETMFLVHAPLDAPLSIPAIRRTLEELGSSVLVAGDARTAKVHLHGDRPDAVIAYGLSLGTLTNVVIENLDAQAAEVRDAREAAVAVEHAVAEGPPGVVGDDGTAGTGEDVPAALAVAAVVAGDGLGRVFRALGVDLLIDGGQSDNPSVGELLGLIGGANARELILLPNNPNVRLAAEHAARLTADRKVVVVPTRNAAEGIAALLHVDRDATADANLEPMRAAARAVETLQVTEAVRDATVSGQRVARGETIVLDPEEGIVAAGDDRDAVVLEAIATLPPDAELITIYFGATAPRVEAEALAARIAQERSTAEVEVVDGGQPHYRYLISAE
jgi:DAK2 domain fusion protein YloV